MACAQVHGSAKVYHEKNKVAVDEMCHKAHQVAKKHCCNKHEAVTGGSIKNDIKGNCLTFLAKHDWAGTNTERYPHTISNFHTGTFVHSSGDCGGRTDEAAVVYTDNCGSAWLLAWSVKHQHGGCGNPNKVYVETGPIANYMNINWCDIKHKLDKSCDRSYFVNDCNGNEAFATITKGNHAALAASYHGY